MFGHQYSDIKKLATDVNLGSGIGFRIRVRKFLYKVRSHVSYVICFPKHVYVF